MTLRRATPVIALFSVLLLAGCSDADSGSDSASASPTPIPAAALTWAGDVCSASTELQESVRALGGAAQLDPSASATSLDQARAQVHERITAVQQSATSLRTSFAAVPAGAGPELATAQQELQVAWQRAQQAVDQVRTAASQVTDAQTPSQIARNLVSLKAALSGAANDLATYVDTLRASVTSGRQAVRDAFAATPACKDVAAAPTTSAA